VAHVAALRPQHRLVLVVGVVRHQLHLQHPSAKRRPKIIPRSLRQLKIQHDEIEEERQIGQWFFHLVTLAL
jgi:hypothetical protein